MNPASSAAGQMVDLNQLHDADDQKTKTIFKSDNVNVTRMFLPAGKRIAEHTARGEITVHCLSGLVDFTVSGKTVQLSAGCMLCLKNREPHSLDAVEDSSLLVTLLRTPDSEI